MASESATASEGLSNAQRLMQEHNAAEKESNSHKVTIEDAVDEDLPRPSATTESASEPTLSAKAAGKKPVSDQSKAGANRLDTQNEEAFPALGAPKAQTATAPNLWSRKPATVGKANGTVNGSSAASKNPSNSSNQVSGGAIPASTAARGPQQMTIPGRYSEQIQLHPSMMTPRSEMKKSLPEILREINKRSKANVELKSGPGGVVVFEGTGPVDAVRVALKEVASQLCARVSTFHSSFKLSR